MHAQEFLQKNNEKVSPIYLLFGEEPFFIQRVRDQILSMVGSQFNQEQDVQAYDMESIAVQEALHDAETFPFFSDHKVILINRASFLTGQTKSEVEHRLDDLIEYVEQPVDFSTVIITAPYEKLDQRKKVVKTLKANSVLIECSPPNAQDMRQMTIQMANSLGLSLPGPVIDLLIERVGDHLEALTQELHKLSLYFKDSEVNFEAAEELISTYAETSTFSLIDAIVENNLGKSLNILKELRKQNEEPIALLALLTSQIRLILQSKLLKHKGYQQQQIAKQVKSHPYAVKMALRRERLFDEKQLKQMIIDGTKTDEKMKTGAMDKWLALELYLQSISTNYHK
ncbi:DNA polymerase III subunit delta [Alkalibacillus aidingensis]|uniref:DNA polymerase III subunit delta n=1 Tax=Alkalibacillus aidingensis TaxID=2747607 RepID=UPI0016614C97|nr:DNA polymerase III subunit delta [Alkalibacillus aidingensis]